MTPGPGRQIVVRVVLLAVVTHVCLGAAGVTLMGQRDADIRAVLEAYDDGEHDALVPLLARVRVADGFGPQLLRTTGDWVGAADGPDRDRRLRVVSLVALEAFEYGAIAPNLTPSDILPLVEWASGRLASRPPDAFEHAWYLAVVAVAGATPAEHPLTGYSNLRYEPSDHGPLIRHARRRFPDEPRFELAEFAIRRVARAIANRPGMALPLLTGLSARTVRPRDMARHIDETLAGLDALRRRDRIGAEASLRSGVIRFHLDRLDEGVPGLEEAASDREPFLRYVANLMLGHVHRQHGHAGAALEAYRLAHAAMPNVMSGSIALSSALFLADRRDEAYDVMESALAERNRVLDPWRLYGWGDYRFWPELRARLRRLAGS